MVNNMKISRYPGARPFEKQQSPLFFGRDKDINTLYRLIKLRSVIALYGKSGTGKSSLLNAGIIPKVVEEGRFVPLVVRFKSYNKDGEVNIMPFETTQQVIRGGKTSTQTFLDRLIKDEDSLWHDVKEHFLRQKGERGLLLIFDQFEELFTYDERAINVFQEQLAEALYTDMPQRYWDALKREQDKGNTPLSSEELQLIQQAPQVKMLISIRADRLHLLSRLDAYLPNILKNNYELSALDEQSATDAIVLPAALPNTEQVFSTLPFAFEPKAVDAILDFLTKNNTEKIESTQLQIICNAIHNRVLVDDLRLVKADDMGDLKAIIGNFYKENIEALPHSEQLPARLLIEDHLIFEEEERRLNLYEGKVLQLVSPQTLASLVDNHLLRAEPSMQGGYTYELSHDTLVAPVLQARVKRVKVERDAEKSRLATVYEQELVESKRIAVVEKRKRRWSNALTVLALLAFLIAAFLGQKTWKNAKMLSNQKDSLEIQSNLLSFQKDSIAGQKETLNKLYLEIVLKDSTLSAVEREKVETLQRANEQALVAQNAISLADKARQQAKIYFDQAKANADSAKVESDKAARFADGLRRKIKELKDTTEILEITRKEAQEFLNQKEKALKLANENAAGYKRLQEEYNLALAKFKAADAAYNNKILQSKKEVKELENASISLKKAQENELNLTRKLDTQDARLRKANQALAVADKRQKIVIKQYEAQLQAVSIQLNDATNNQNQALVQLLEKKREVLIASQMQAQATQSARQARLELEVKTQELEQLKFQMTGTQMKNPAINAEINELKKDIVVSKTTNQQYTIQQNKDNALRLKQQELDEAKAKLATAQNNATKAQNELATKQRELEKCQANVVTTVKSPINTLITTPSVSKLSFEPEMVFVQGGTFQMGSNVGERDEKPVHSVTVRDFSIGKFEVTNAQFCQFLNEKGNQSESDAETETEWVNLSDNYSYGSEKCRIQEQGAGFIVEKGYDNYPIIYVNYHGAIAYARWLSSKTGKKYRLPTEMEWEYAARGGNKSKNFTYSGSNIIADVAWYDTNAEHKIHAVGGKIANELELYDMSGNVWEWCSDWFKAYPNSLHVSDYKEANRVCRGGSWSNSALFSRVAYRYGYTPTNRFNYLGFRLVSFIQ
jgi:formylglycine-generating enzyme required for sulfatase activity